MADSFLKGSDCHTRCGCYAHNCCLTCPLEVCIYDSFTFGIKKRNEAIKADYLTWPEIAKKYRVSLRTVARAKRG